MPVEPARGLRLGGDVFPHRETQRRELTHLAEQRHELRVVVQLDVSGVRGVQVHQLGPEVELELAEAVHDTLLPLLEQLFLELGEFAANLPALRDERRALSVGGVALGGVARPGDKRARGFLRGRHALQALHCPHHALHHLGGVPPRARLPPVLLAHQQRAAPPVARGFHVREEPLEALTHFRALALERARHRRPAQQLGVLRHLAEHLVRLRGGVGGFALVVLQRRRQRRQQARAEVLAQLLGDARLRRAHAAVVVGARRVPQRRDVLAHLHGVQARERTEHLRQCQRPRLLRREQLRQLSLRLAHLEHLVAPLLRFARRGVGERRAAPRARAVRPVHGGQFMGDHLPLRKQAVAETQRALDFPEGVRPDAPRTQTPLRVADEKRTDGAHEVLGAALREGLARPDAPRRVEAIGYDVHEVQRVFLSHRFCALQSLEALLQGLERAVHIRGGGARAPRRGFREGDFGPHLDLVQGRDYAHQRRGGGVHRARVGGEPAGQTQVVPQAGLELGEEPNELGVDSHAAGAAHHRAVHALELRVQRADGRVRHGGDGDVRGDVRRGQRARLELGEHHLAR